MLYEVNYSESICIQAEKGKYEIVYDANGGQNISGDSDRVSICYRGTHQRINTSTGTDLFARDGYTLLGWNTRADGTGQAEFYGLNSWFPTTVAHTRQIPGTRKVMATFMGHHNPQHGKLGIIDPEAGR